MTVPTPRISRFPSGNSTPKNALKTRTASEKHHAAKSAIQSASEARSRPKKQKRRTSTIAGAATGSPLSSATAKSQRPLLHQPKGVRHPVLRGAGSGLLADFDNFRTHLFHGAIRPSQSKPGPPAANDLAGAGGASYTIDSFGTGEVYLYLGGLHTTSQPASVFRHPDYVVGSSREDGFGAALD